jgi:hypothetical protein
MPVRFITPSLGGQRQQDVGPHQWQVGLAYRRLTANEWYVGTQVQEDKAPFGGPLELNINSLDLTVIYGVTSRFSLALTVPFSHGKQTRWYVDSLSHTVSAAGLGDINLLGRMWLRDPAEGPAGNLSLGVGVKTPSGSNHVQDDFFTKTGTTRYFVDQSIQLGDGGWGILLQTQGFQRLSGRLYGYLSGSYLASPRKKTDVHFPTINGVASSIILSVPDVYSARWGVAYVLAPEHSLSASLGGRLDGIRVRDVLGGSDDGFRRPGYELYLDPGVSYGLGNGTLTVSVPVRLTQDFKPDLVPMHPKGGDLAEYLIFAGYTYRF